MTQNIPFNTPGIWQGIWSVTARNNSNFI